MGKGRTIYKRLVLDMEEDSRLKSSERCELTAGLMVLYDDAQHGRKRKGLVDVPVQTLEEVRETKKKASNHLMLYRRRMRSSPAGSHEILKLELLGAWKARGSSRVSL